MRNIIETGVRWFNGQFLPGLNRFGRKVRDVWYPYCERQAVRRFRALLDYLAAHAVGLLTTLVIHLFLCVLFLFLQLTSLRRTDTSFYVDLSVLSEAELQRESRDIELTRTPVPTWTSTMSYRDIPVNVAEAEHRAADRISRMVDEVKSELNVRDLKPMDPEDLSSGNDPEELLPNEADIREEALPVDDPGNRTVYSGPSHVTYVLANRTHTRMRVPAYKCRGAGKVVVDIVVNQRGYVIAATVNASLSTTSDACFVNAARSEAERSRFNADSAAPERQAGTITYIFEAQ